MNESVIVGEVVAGEAAQALKQVKQLVKSIAVNTFDLFEALYRVRKNKFYTPKFSTFAEYANSLDIKPSKIYYGCKLVECMTLAGIPREKYEPVGVGKLRAITRLEILNKEGQPNLHEGVPISLIVKDLVEQAHKYSPEDLELKVKVIQGLVGDNASSGWINFPVTFAQRGAWEKAVALALLQIGSTTLDPNTEKYKDASLGAAAEVIAVSYILDPNNVGEETEPDGEVEQVP